MFGGVGIRTLLWSACGKARLAALHQEVVRKPGLRIRPEVLVLFAPPGD